MRLATRLVLLALAGAALAGPLHGQVRAAQQRKAPAAQAIVVCVVDRGELRQVSALLDPATGDTATLAGGAFRAAYGPGSQYAAAHSWFVAAGTLRLPSGKYRRQGPTRVIRADALRRIGWYPDAKQGVAVYAAAQDGPDPRLVYLPVRPGCVFQPYVR